MIRRTPRSTRTDALFPYTTLFRSGIEKMGMALRGRQHAGRFAVGLAQVAVGGTRDQAPRLRAARHFPQHPLEIIRREGEAVAQGFQRAVAALRFRVAGHPQRSEEHTSELESLMRISYAVFCLKK